MRSLSAFLSLSLFSLSPSALGWYQRCFFLGFSLGSSKMGGGAAADNGGRTPSGEWLPLRLAWGGFELVLPTQLRRAQREMARRHEYRSSALAQLAWAIFMVGPAPGRAEEFEQSRRAAQRGVRQLPFHMQRPISVTNGGKKLVFDNCFPSWMVDFHRASRYKELQPVLQSLYRVHWDAYTSYRGAVDTALRDDWRARLRACKLVCSNPSPAVLDLAGMQPAYPRHEPGRTEERLLESSSRTGHHDQAQRAPLISQPAPERPPAPGGPRKELPAPGSPMKELSPTRPVRDQQATVDRGGSESDQPGVDGPALASATAPDAPAGVAPPVAPVLGAPATGQGRDETALEPEDFILTGAPGSAPLIGPAECPADFDPYRGASSRELKYGVFGRPGWDTSEFWLKVRGDYPPLEASLGSAWRPPWRMPDLWEGVLPPPSPARIAFEEAREAFAGKEAHRAAARAKMAQACQTDERVHALALKRAQAAKAEFQQAEGIHRQIVDNRTAPKVDRQLDEELTYRLMRLPHWVVSPYLTSSWGFRSYPPDGFLSEMYVRERWWGHLTEPVTASATQSGAGPAAPYSVGKLREEDLYTKVVADRIKFPPAEGKVSVRDLLAEPWDWVFSEEHCKEMVRPRTEEAAGGRRPYLHMAESEKPKFWRRVKEFLMFIFLDPNDPVVAGAPRIGLFALKKNAQFDRLIADAVQGNLEYIAGKAQEIYERWLDTNPVRAAELGLGRKIMNIASPSDLVGLPGGVVCLTQGDFSNYFHTLLQIADFRAQQVFPDIPGSWVGGEFFAFSYSCHAGVRNGQSPQCYPLPRRARVDSAPAGGKSTCALAARAAHGRSHVCSGRSGGAGGRGRKDCAVQGSCSAGGPSACSGTVAGGQAST